jgi:hypothetical protein
MTATIYGLAPDAFYALLGALVGAFIGFVLFAFWDKYKAWQSDKRQRVRVLTLLALEMTENLTRVDIIQKMMQDELAVSGLGKIVVTTPPRLTMDGWNLAKAENILDFVTLDALREWILLYANIAMMNSNLECRELFRTTGLSDADYNDRVAELDKMILDGSGPLLTHAKKVIDSLPKDIRDSLKGTIPEVIIPSLPPPTSYQQEKPPT